MERSLDIQNGKWKKPLEILKGISDGTLEWPVLEVRYKKIIELENAVVCQYIGDYELAGGYDVLSPIKLLEKNKYKYFIFDFRNTITTDHFLGIPQVLYCKRQENTKNFKSLIICYPGFEDIIKLIGLFELVGKDIFVRDLKEALKIIRSYDTQSI